MGRCRKKDRIRSREYHAQKLNNLYSVSDWRITEDFLSREVHDCPECVVDMINHTDSKGRLNGYAYHTQAHIGGSLFLRGSAEDFRTWQAGLENNLGKKTHQKYYK